MTVTLSTDAKEDLMTALRDLVADGSLEIGASGMETVLATFGLSPSGGTVSGPYWTLAFDNTTVVSTATGTAAAARIKDSSGTVQITGLTVATSGADITVNQTDIGIGQYVTVSSAMLSHP